MGGGALFWTWLYGVTMRLMRGRERSAIERRCSGVCHVSLGCFGKKMSIRLVVIFGICGAEEIKKADGNVGNGKEK